MRYFIGNINTREDNTPFRLKYEGTKTQAELCERDGDDYKDEAVSAMWCGYRMSLEKARLFDALVELAGSWQDASSQLVIIGDDDACRIHIMTVGKHRFTGSTIAGCVKQAADELLPL